MRRSNTVFALLVVSLLAGCTGDIPTAVPEGGAEFMAKGDSGAVVYRGMSGDMIMMMVDEKNDLMMVVYGSDTLVEPLFETYGFYCDLPAATVQSELQTVTNPSNDSGMWRFRGPAAVAVFDYPEALVFPPPEPVYCSDHLLVAYGVMDIYRETGNDFWFAADRTLTFGLTGKGVINNAMAPGEVEIRVNARGMYLASDIHEGIFNSLTRNTNIRLSPDPRG